MQGTYLRAEDLWRVENGALIVERKTLSKGFPENNGLLNSDYERRN